MKYVDENNLDRLPGRRIGETDTFTFECHPEIECFNRCCRNLNLFLYPYDIIRLRSRLGIHSDRFLDEYVHVVMRETSFFPEVLLRMQEDEEKTCPFLSDSGCSVYPDRPDTCRTFPIEQGLSFPPGDSTGKKVSFFRPPDFCLGRHEKKAWTLKTWAQDQEASVYNQMTVNWAQLKKLFHTDPWGSEGFNGPKGKMAFMATYNMDPFRDFVFNSSFLNRYKVKSALQKKIKQDDAQLMKFGFEWVKLFVWGIKGKNIRPRR
jgi:Fe-S-cluster containining protein